MAVLHQLLGQHLFARGVDALADDLKRILPAEGHGGPPAGEHQGRGVRRGGPGVRHFAHGCAQGAYVRGRGAAAAAQKLRAHLRKHAALPGEVVRPQAEVRAARLVQLRQARVGLHQKRRGEPGQHGAHYLHNLLRPGGAVGAEEIHAQVLHGVDESQRRRAGERLRALKSHGHAHGQVAHLARGDDDGLGLGQVELGLGQDEVGPARNQALYLLLVGGHHVAEAYIAQRRDEVPAGADAAGHKGAAVHGALGRSGQLAVQSAHVLAHIELEARAAKGVGGDDLGPGARVFRMDGGHGFGVLEAVDLRRDTGGQPARLQKRAEAAVEKVDAAISQQRTKVGHEISPSAVGPGGPQAGRRKAFQADGCGRGAQAGPGIRVY